MFLPFIYTAITFIAISAVVVLLISLFVQPKAKHLSFRKIPLKQFRLLGRAALIFSIVLALMVVPTTITMASAYRALSNDYASWESLKDAVGISYNDVNGLHTAYGRDQIQRNHPACTAKGSHSGGLYSSCRRDCCLFHSSPGTAVVAVIIGCTVFDVCTVEFCWVYFLFEARVFANVI